MMDDTITLALNGEVTLDDFSRAMGRFTALVTTLSQEVAVETHIDWIVAGLEAGSAVATVRGVSENPEPVGRVVEAYGTMANAMETRSTIPYSQDVVAKAHDLINIIDGRITSLGFMTNTVDAVIVSRQAWEAGARKAKYSYGVIKGIVESISRRRGLKFTLYDEVFDRSIVCRVKEDQKEQMRDIWGKRVAVSGRIRRDPIRGNPVSITEITKLRVLPDRQPGGWRRAIGILPLAPDAEMPETIIRRLRDAG